MIQKDNPETQDSSLEFPSIQNLNSYRSEESETVADVAVPVPLDFAFHVLDVLQLVAQLHDGEVDHSRVQPECAADR